MLLRSDADLADSVAGKQPRRDPLYLPEGDRSAQAGLEQPGGRKPDHIAHQLISKRKTEWQDPV